MKTTKLLTVLLLFVAMVFAAKVNAQETTRYYFAWAYSYQTSEPVLIIANIKQTSCVDHWDNPINDTKVALQWNDYMKSEYKDYYKFTKEEYVSDSEYQAQKRRREVMGNWQHKIIKVDDFKVYCDN